MKAEREAQPIPVKKVTPTPALALYPLPPGVVKLNVDGAVNSKDVVVGVSIVARDHLGQILGRISIPFMGFLSPRLTEALSFRKALSVVANRNFSSIIVEGDSAQVVQALNQEGSFSDCSSIISYGFQLAALFSSCTFVHVNCSCNRATHLLAQQSLLGAKWEDWGVLSPNLFLILSLMMFGL